MRAAPLLLLLAACAAAPDEAEEQAGSSTTRIVAGTPSTAAQDATVLITNDGSVCSGSAIAPNLVMTARHCVSELTGNDPCHAGFSSNANPANLLISVGVRANGDRPQPVARGARLLGPSDPDICGNDIAFIVLDRDLSVPTVKVRFTKPVVGETVTAVGYGEDGTTHNLTPVRFQRTGMKVLALGPSTFTFTRRSGQAVPVEVPAGELATTEGSCHGDSGGPLLDGQGQVVGVVSRGGLPIDTCIDSVDIYTDVWSHADLVRDALTIAGHPAAPAAELEVEEPAAADDDVPPTTSKKKKTSSSDDEDDDDSAPSTRAAAAGCHAAAGDPEPLLGLALVLLVLARRRR